MSNDEDETFEQIRRRHNIECGNFTMGRPIKNETSFQMNTRHKQEEQAWVEKNNARIKHEQTEAELRGIQIHSQPTLNQTVITKDNLYTHLSQEETTALFEFKKSGRNLVDVLNVTYPSPIDSEESGLSTEEVKSWINEFGKVFQKDAQQEWDERKKKEHAEKEAMLKRSSDLSIYPKSFVWAAFPHGTPEEVEEGHKRAIEGRKKWLADKTLQQLQREEKEAGRKKKA